MEIELFRDLERLHRTGNFSQAAALGNVSQPAFSRRIQALEAWVGVPLVDRSRQPVRLTEAGEQMLEAGLQALSRIEHQRGQILELRALPDKYVVTFAAQHSIGWRFFPAWLQALEQGHGPIMSRLRADDLDACLKALQDGDADFVIAYASKGVAGPAELNPGLESLRIGADRLIPVCKPQPDGTPIFSLERAGAPLPFLRFGAGAPIARHLAPLFTRERIVERLATVYENSMAGALRMRARAGDGIAWLPASLVRPDIEAGLLVQTGPPHWMVPLSIEIYRSRERTNRVTRSIWSWLEVRQSVPLVSEG